MANNIPKISVVLPILNEAGNIEKVYSEIKKAIQQSESEYEIIFIDDGSSDNSLDIIKRIREKDKKVFYVSFSRNFGHQNAIFAGLSHATGDATIAMDADMQHPPSLIPKMVQMWKNGVEIVYTKKNEYKLPVMKSLVIKISYRFISAISGLKLSFGQSDFRLMDRKVQKVILDMPEYHKFLRGQVEWIGFKQEGLSYNVEKRHAGEAKYSYKKLSELALNGIFSFGKYPLHLVMLLSLAIFGIALVYIFSIFLIWILKILNIVHIPMPSGWTTVVVSMSLFGSVQLMAIGILSEYVGRVYDQTKGRPAFIVREKLTSKE